MRRFLKSFKGTRKFSVFFALAMILPITNPCDFIGAFFGGEQSNPVCKPFVFVNPTGNGLPFGPVEVDWVPVPGAIAYTITVFNDYGDILGQASAGAGDKTASITLDPV